MKYKLASQLVHQSNLTSRCASLTVPFISSVRTFQGFVAYNTWQHNNDVTAINTWFVGVVKVFVVVSERQ